MPMPSIKDDVLALLPNSVRKIAAEIGCTEVAVRDNLRDLAREQKVHVSCLRAEGGRGPVWSKGPAGPGSPPQPAWNERRKKPRNPQVESISEDETIRRARANPSTWFSGLC